MNRIPLFAAAACGTALAADTNSSTHAVAAVNAPAPTASPTAAESPSAKPTTAPQPLAPANPGADPVSLLGFLFTPIFQGLFLLLVGLYALTGNILVAIILMTIMIRLVTVKLSARQILSQKRMQILGPELRELTKELNRRYKGDRLAIQRHHAGTRMASAGEHGNQAALAVGHVDEHPCHGGLTA